MRRPTAWACCTATRSFWIRKTRSTSSWTSLFCTCSATGKTPFSAALRNSPSRPGSDERAYLESRVSTHYRIWQVLQPHPGFGVTIRDMLRNEEGLLMDVALSGGGKQGDILAGHVHAFPGFWMTTGGGLAHDARHRGRAHEEAAPPLRQVAPRLPRAFAEEEANCAAWSIHSALEAGGRHIATPTSAAGATADSRISVCTTGAARHTGRRAAPGLQPGTWQSRMANKAVTGRSLGVVGLVHRPETWAGEVPSRRINSRLLSRLPFTRCCATRVSL